MIAGARILDIEPADYLYRRLMWYYVVKTTDGERASSAAFREGSKNNFSADVSVYLARLTTPAAVLSSEAGGLPKQRLAQLQASVPLDLGLEVRHVPISAIEGTVGYAHSEISGIRVGDLEPLASGCRILDPELS